jgi:Zn-dependent M28 family amino/carboxypeptidase
METRLIAGLLLGVMLGGCGGQPDPAIQWRAFDEQRAYGHVEKLVSYGPRPSGSPALIRSATYIATPLQEFGLDAEEQAFIASTPQGPVTFRNVFSRTRRQTKGDRRIIILGSHFDTKHLPGMNFVGANDGGSSVGVLLEMARVASGQADLWFVFFDGEECMREYSSTDGLWGSKYFVEHLKAKQQLPRIKALILLDMVGDVSLNIILPSNASPELNQRLLEAARDTGHRDYFGLFGGAIYDDHVPFLQAGIPAMNIIDFQYGSSPGLNDHWHTENDNLKNVSPRSLEIVGQTTLRLIEMLKQSSHVR